MSFRFRFLLPISFLLLAGQVCWASSHVTITKTSHRIGDSTIQTWLYEDGDPGPTYLVLHSNEHTSFHAALNMVEKYGGRVIEIRSGYKRVIKFAMDGRTILFDPNRAFSKKGRHDTLLNYDPHLNYGTHNKKVNRAVETFMAEIVTTYDLANRSVIFAMHENTDGKYSIQSYQKGDKRSRNAKRVFRNPKQDPDDFIFTNSEKLFEALKKKGINSVLQDRENAEDDGSFSIFASRRDITYINIEAQYHHHTMQRRMLQAILEIMRKK